MNDLQKVQTCKDYTPYADTVQYYKSIRSLSPRSIFLIKLILCLFATLVGGQVVWAALVTIGHCFSIAPVYGVCAVLLSMVWIASLGNMWRLAMKARQPRSTIDALTHTEKIAKIGMGL
ncbi:MAG: hypothetical protein ACYC46_15415 [Acidobacteriaceae bacterium]